MACWYTQPEKGGLKGMFGVANETSDVSLACRQYGPIKFKEKFAEGDEVFAQRRSLFFKHMQIVRGCDAKRNVLVYMVYTDKLIDGSPKNSTSTVPVMPWGASHRHAALRRLPQRVEREWIGRGARRSGRPKAEGLHEGGGLLGAALIPALVATLSGGLVLFRRVVVADRAAGRGAHLAVAHQMAGDAADDRTLDAALGVRRRRGERSGGGSENE